MSKTKALKSTIEVLHMSSLTIFHEPRYTFI